MSWTPLDLILRRVTDVTDAKITMMITGMVRQALDVVKRIGYIQHGYFLPVSGEQFGGGT